MDKMRERLKNLDMRGLWERYSTVGLIIVLLLLFTLFGDGGAWTLDNYESIVLSNTGLMVTVVGLSFVMVGGNIDLSIGYQISLLSVLIGLLTAQGFPSWAVIAGILLVGVGCGLLNGILVGYLEIVPFAATIATQIIFRGCSFVLSQGRMSSNMASGIRQITRTHFWGLHLDMWLAAAAFLLLCLVLRGSFLGKHLRAIGLDEPAAARAGIRVKRVKCLSYCLAGFFYAVAAMVLTSRRGYCGSEIGVGMEITAIVAAYVGGILTFAAKQRVLMLLMGTMVVAVVENGLVKVGMNIYIQYIITGIILIVSMTFHNRKKNAP